MTSLTFAAVMHAALLSTGDAKYAEAHKLNAETGRPLVVLVGAEWCPACRVMKQSTLPQVAQSGLLGRVAYAEVNTDHESALAEKLMTGGSIPQLIMYRRTSEGWQRMSLVGSQSQGQVESFIKKALESTPTDPASSQRLASDSNF